MLCLGDLSHTSMLSIIGYESTTWHIRKMNQDVIVTGSEISDFPFAISDVVCLTKSQKCFSNLCALYISARATGIRPIPAVAAPHTAVGTIMSFPHAPVRKTRS